MELGRDVRDVMGVAVAVTTRLRADGKAEAATNVNQSLGKAGSLEEWELHPIQAAAAATATTAARQEPRRV